MTTFRAIFTAVAIATVIAPANAADRSCKSNLPVNSIREMFDAISACWQPPANIAGLSMTLRFSLRRDGTLIGQPRVTYKEGLSPDQNSRAFELSVFDALNRALPIPFTDSMGGAIAGRPIALRF